MSGFFRLLRGAAIACSVLFVMACGRSFQPRDYANPESLFRAAMQEFEAGRNANAILGFERLTIDLASSDSLLVPTYFYMALAHERQREFLLAAQAFGRLSESFPTDTLAPYAVLGEGRAYQSLWRKSVLDAEYGLKALATFRVLLSAFPDRPQAAEASERILVIEDMLAQKDYEVGVHYMRTRKAYDSAIIYFRDVVETYPGTPTARLAWLGLLKSYTARKWNEEAIETCEEMKRKYSDDEEVAAACSKLSPASSEPSDM